MLKHPGALDRGGNMTHQSSVRKSGPTSPNCFATSIDPGLMHLKPWHAQDQVIFVHLKDNEPFCTVKVLELDRQIHQDTWYLHQGSIGESH
ncbi:unnamed protein product [Phytophthora fragariaefolia]|uniref:Unnamed protein product n=1 Tax=Phytophthora fragariaefolia TaxID=1490495 RepID=A0A9W6XZ59_9STRA|nr:unnamed protein product [Phytophthora fragariaefolia]